MKVKRWMFQDVHEGGPAAAGGIDPGDIVLAIGNTEIKPPTPLVFKMGESATLTLRKLDGRVLVATLNVPTPKDRKHPVSQPKSVLFLSGLRMAPASSKSTCSLVRWGSTWPEKPTRLSINCGIANAS